MAQGDRFRVPRSRAYMVHESLRAEIREAFEPLLFGPMQHAYQIRASLEAAFAETMQQPHAVAVHSGTMGLFLALRACGIQPDDEVITVGNSDISTTAAIRQCGAVPVLCDVLEEDYTIDPALVESLITPRTRALLPVDLHGHPADVRALRPLADRYGLRIIEDAALATGASDHGQPAGYFADASIFSFAPYKPLGSVGNGAIVVTRDPQINEALRLLAGYGHSLETPDEVLPGHQHYAQEGYNVPMDGLQAALVLLKLPHLQSWTAKRQMIAQAYQTGLADSPIMLPRLRPESSPTFRSYVIRVPEARRQQIYEHLRRVGVEVVLHYTPAVYDHPVYGGQLPGSDALHVTRRLADELICLPVTPELTEDDTDYVIFELMSQFK